MKNTKVLSSILFDIYIYIISFVILGVFIWFALLGECAYILLQVISYLIISFVICNIYEGFKIGQYRVSEVVYSVSLAVLITNVLFCFINILISFELKWVYTFFLLQVIQTLLILLWGYIGNKLYFKIYNHHQILLVYGSDPDAISRKITSRKNRYFISQMISEEMEITELLELCFEYDSIMLFEVRKELRDLLTVFCFESDINLFLIPEIPEIIRRGTKNLYLMDTPLLVSNCWGLSHSQVLFKRFMDLFIVIPISVIAIPFMILVAIAIKLYDGGPVIYRQARLTKDGKVFSVLKFRSMIINAESKGAQLSVENDSRITPVGKVIRMLRLDELPQLINILKGEMSIVGPRPERPEIASEYMESFPEFGLRLKVKAGLTGYAQVFGKYNTTPKDKLKLDLMYVNDYSFALDIKLIIYTIKILFMKHSTEGIQEGKKTAI